ncbi:MAG: SRPBCC domain-containing protein [Actinomycetes bacterium]
MTETHVTGSVAPVLRTVQVRRPPQEAFRLFTDRIDAWWPVATHSVFGDASDGLAFEDGLLVERSRAGERSVWGEVTQWSPPHRLALTWHPGDDSGRCTHLEIDFRSDGDGGTRVELVHSGWEVLAAHAAQTRAGYASGWVGVLEHYERAADAGE